MTEAQKQIEPLSVWRGRDGLYAKVVGTMGGGLVAAQMFDYGNNGIPLEWFDNAQLIESPSSPPVEIGRGVVMAEGEPIQILLDGQGRESEIWADESVELERGQRVRVLVVREEGAK